MTEKTSGSAADGHQEKPLDSVEVDRICRSLLGAGLEHLSFPGGRSRKTVVASTVDGKTYAITKRPKPNRAALEVAVMRALNARQAPVPNVVASSEGWLVQSYIGSRRLSEVLDSANLEELNSWLRLAMDSLVEIHTAGREAGLNHKVARIGVNQGWLEQLMTLPERIGELVQLPAPQFDKNKLAAQLSIPNPAFIKWDARPGNAMVSDQGKILWIDWEHCGARDPLDDLCWMLGDEWTPYNLEMEEQLLQEYLPLFSGERSSQEACDYLRSFGSLHMCVRLLLILSRKGEGEWWNRQKSLAGDKIGVTADSAERLCRRAAHWSALSPMLAPLSSWFVNVQATIAKL